MQQRGKHEAVRHERERSGTASNGTNASQHHGTDQQLNDEEVFEGISVRGVLWRWQVRRRRNA